HAGGVGGLVGRAGMAAGAVITLSTSAPVLSFAAVGLHGREWCTRTIILALAVAPVTAQTISHDTLSLAIRTLIATRAPILDVLESADRLVVLSPTAIALYAAADALGGAPAIASIAVTHSRPWPRDVRGQLRAT